MRLDLESENHGSTSHVLGLGSRDQSSVIKYSNFLIEDNNVHEYLLSNPCLILSRKTWNWIKLMYMNISTTYSTLKHQTNNKSGSPWPSGSLWL